MLSASTVWETALSSLKEELTPATYETWFKELKPVIIENGDTLVLSTHLAFYKSTLEALYQNTVTRCVNSANNTLSRVRFVMTDEAEGLLRTAQACSSEKSASACSTLMSNYTFDNFIMGESNRFAYSAALAVADNPSNAYNPLFIYGGVGLGKTHLTHAIGNAIHKRHPDYVLLYVSSENFMHDVVNSIRTNDRLYLRQKYRSLNVLLIDDIQFIAGKDATETEFFNVFNDLRDANSQIIITSDKPARDIPILHERLKTRFNWGLTVDIKPPDFETRCAILQSKSMQHSFMLPADVVSFIAERMDSNIRELEGCFNRIMSYSQLSDQPVTLAFAENVLKDYLPGNRRREVTVDLIKQVVADYYGLELSDMLSERRSQRVAKPRQIAMYFACDLTSQSLSAIGDQFGGKHHTTVSHARDCIETDIAKNNVFNGVISDIRARILSS